jgi:hypothetical protein
MIECISQLRLGFHPTVPVTVGFDAPQISSDGGVLLLRQTDDRLGLSEWFARLLPDERDPAKVKHERREQVRQRLYQIALGYEDCNDADRLRHDPLLKSVCDRTPTDAGLSSQPTLSRLENTIEGRTLRAILQRLEEHYLQSLPAVTEVIILDIGTTDDPTHGQQQLSFFHGYYDQHMYHPLLIFDGESGQLVTAVLRPGNTHAARGALGVLRRIIRTLKQRFPAVQIVVRGDSGFAVPRLLELLEALDREVGGVAYLFGLAQNPVLLRRGTAALATAHDRFGRTQQAVQHFDTFPYAAESWPHERCVVMKAEVNEHGQNPRFVVTSLEGFAPEVLYHAYCQRGQCENCIKDFKNAVQADRLSCSTFAANFFRLLEHPAAYVLLHALRTHVAPYAPTLGTAQFDTLRLRLLKVAALVTHSTRRLLVRFPQAFPLAALFRTLAATLAPPPVLSSA